MEDRRCKKILVTVLSAVGALAIVLLLIAHFGDDKKINSIDDSLVHGKVELTSNINNQDKMAFKSIAYHPLLTNIQIHDYLTGYLYYDAVGDGNCGYYAILFLIYDRLRDPKSTIYKNLFENNYLDGLDVKFQAIIAKNDCLQIIKNGQSFTGLPKEEYLKIIKYVRLLIRGFYIQSEDARKCFAEQVLSIDHVTNNQFEFMDTPALMVFSTIIGVHINVLAVVQRNQKPLLVYHNYAHENYFDETLELLLVGSAAAGHYQALARGDTISKTVKILNRLANYDDIQVFNHNKRF